MAPMACGMALAIEPWLNEAQQAAFTIHFEIACRPDGRVPTSQVKMASSSAKMTDLLRPDIAGEWLYRWV
ncbi:hypothetical protein LNP20_13130 [Klebsiella pneumoniae subsp. pneumoniae]|nr:hypothetical protein [Klebsiella pneumoniae subsp. pneumoniae]